MTAAARPIRAGCAIFLAEKGITVPTEQVDLGKLEQRSDAFTAINPMQRVPALVLDDGTVIAESIAICRYFEALNPEPPLFGRGALEIALVEMWQRRVRAALALSGRDGVPAHASGDEDHGRSAGRGMGRGQQAAGRAISAVPRRRAQEADHIVAGDGLQRRRHHRDGCGRFHARVEARRCRTNSPT